MCYRKGNDDDQNFMKAKTSQGKKLAFGFLSRVGSKDKYAKRLDKLKQGVLQGNSDLNGPLQPGAVQHLSVYHQESLSSDCLSLGLSRTRPQRRGCIAHYVPSAMTENLFKESKLNHASSFAQEVVPQSSGGLIWRRGCCRRELKTWTSPLESTT